MKDEIKKAITDLIYTADAKPRTTFTDGSPLEKKIQLIDDAVTKVLNIINSQPRKICWWSIEDVESQMRQINLDRIDFGQEPIHLTRDDKNAILDMIEEGFDANYGITWDSVNDAIIDYLDEIEDEIETRYITNKTDTNQQKQSD